MQKGNGLCPEPRGSRHRVISPGGNIWAMPAPQCRCSASFGPKASNGLLLPQVAPVAGLFHAPKRARAEAGSCREPWPPCPAPSPGPLGGSRPPSGLRAGGAAEALRSPSLAKGMVPAEKRAAAGCTPRLCGGTAFPGEKKANGKGNGQISPRGPVGTGPRAGGERRSQFSAPHLGESLGC